MLRLYDTRTGQAEPVEQVRNRELRLYTCGPAHGYAHAGDLRPFLLSDLIRRTAERRKLLVTASAAVASDDDTAADRLRADCDALNIRPAEHLSRAAGPVAQLSDLAGHPGQGGSPFFDVCATDADAELPRELARHWARSEHVLFEGRKMADSAAAPAVADLTARGLDPLALRLAFFGHHYREQMNLSWDALQAADRTVRRWRERVAGWAQSPSKPMCAQYVSEITAAFDDDLDTPAALRRLDALERDEEIPPGSRFETFAHLDQLFGLDMAREIGKPAQVEK
jgi:cysteinyl-tRNA synthetase